MGEPAHVHSASGTERRLFWAMVLTAGFMMVEAAGAVFAGSLALLADAGHMLADGASLALAWLAFRAAHRPSDPRRSYGYARLQVLAAFVHGVVLVLLSLWIVVEAGFRLAEPRTIEGGLMLGVAAAGLLVNVVAFAVLHGGDRRNLNVQGAIIHVLGDLLSSLAAVGAAVVILLTGWTPIDPLLSIAVALVIARVALKLLARSAHVLLEGTPEGFDVDGLKDALRTGVPGLLNVHHVHLWALTAEHPLLTLHARVAANADRDAALAGVHAILGQRYGIDHATVQLESGPCPDEAAEDRANAAGTAHG